MSSNKEKPINLVKHIAESLLPSVMLKLGVEDTAENREDILALALNSLPAKYVNSDGGRLYAELVENYKVQYQTDVLAGLTRAAIKVKNSPRNAERTGR